MKKKSMGDITPNQPPPPAHATANWTHEHDPKQVRHYCSIMSTQSTTLLYKSSSVDTTRRYSHRTHDVLTCNQPRNLTW